MRVGNRDRSAAWLRRMVGLISLCGLLALSPTLARGEGVQTETSPAAGGESSAPARNGIERAWFESGASLLARGPETRRAALRLGVPNDEAAARALISVESSEDHITNRMLAVRLAPDLPMAHIALAVGYARDGQYVEAISEAAAGVIAIPRHLEASIWLLGSVLLMFATVLIVGSLAFIIGVGLSKAANAAHDLGDVLSHEMPPFARAALISVLILVPLVLGEGVLGLVLVLFGVGFAYGGPRHRMALCLAVTLVVIGLYPMLTVGGRVLTALDAEPVASASLAVLRGNETREQIEMLDAAAHEGDPLANLSMALLARMQGETEQARVRLERALESDPSDVTALTTLANISFEQGNTTRAIELYEQAAEVEVSATLMFNLSQAYAKAFRMDEFDATMARAQAMDGDRVQELSRNGDTDFVADIPIGIAGIRARMLESADGAAFSRQVVALLAPGLLGASWLHTAAAFLLMAMISFIVSGLYQHAGRCARCGHRICARCDDSMWSSDLCDGCHHLFHRPQGTDPALRTARVQALRAREDRLERMYFIACLVVPGVSGLMARRPDLSFLGILLFCGAAVLFIWRHGVVVDPLAVGGAGPLAFVLAGCVAAVCYVAVMLSGIFIRRSL